MCRLILVEADTPAQASLAGRVLEALYKAASHDRLKTRGEKRHCDGAGILVVAELGKGLLVHHETVDSTCEDNLEALRGYPQILSSVAERANGKILVIAHARRASPGMPRGAEYAHPVRVPLSLASGAGSLFLAHNGTLKREELARIIGANPVTETDTRLMARIVAQRIEGSPSTSKAAKRAVSKILGLASHMVSALVTVGAIVGPRDYAFFCTSLAAKDMNYYLLKHISAHGFKGFVSPTVAYYLEQETTGISVKDLTGRVCPSEQ